MSFTNNHIQKNAPDRNRVQRYNKYFIYFGNCHFQILPDYQLEVFGSENSQKFSSTSMISFAKSSILFTFVNQCEIDRHEHCWMF